MKPLWLLDIDGVINAVPRGNQLPDAWPAGSWNRKDVTNSGGTWPILAADAVLDFITEVHETGLAEIRWHTSWQEEALDFGDAFLLPDFQVQECPEAVRNYYPDWWKLPAVKRELNKDTGRDLLWTDDEITYKIQARYRKDLEKLPGVKLICPNTETGLTPVDLDDIRKFLEGRS